MLVWNEELEKLKTKFCTDCPVPRSRLDRPFFRMDQSIWKKPTEESTNIECGWLFLLWNTETEAIPDATDLPRETVLIPASETKVSTVHQRFITWTSLLIRNRNVSSAYGKQNLQPGSQSSFNHFDHESVDPLVQYALLLRDNPKATTELFPNFPYVLI